jgi:hypothetical protein
MRDAWPVTSLKDQDIEFGYSGGNLLRDRGLTWDILWDGNGVTVTEYESNGTHDRATGPQEWWSCQPDGKRSKGGVLPWE